MGMLAYKGKHPTIQDAFIAKNYLNDEELQTLNHLVSAYLDLAELQAHRKRVMYMNDWIAKLDEYLKMTDCGIIENAGSISSELAKHHARAEYGEYKSLHSTDITPVEQAFLEILDDTSDKLRKRKK